MNYGDMIKMSEKIVIFLGMLLGIVYSSTTTEEDVILNATIGMAVSICIVTLSKLSILLYLRVFKKFHQR